MKDKRKLAEEGEGDCQKKGQRLPSALAIVFVIPSMRRILSTAAGSENLKCGLPSGILLCEMPSYVQILYILCVTGSCGWSLSLPVIFISLLSFSATLVCKGALDTFLGSGEGRGLFSIKTYASAGADSYTRCETSGILYT